MEPMEVSIESVQTHDQIPKRMKNEISRLHELDNLTTFTVFVTPSKEWPCRLRLQLTAEDAKTLVFDISPQYPFRAPLVTLDKGLESVQKALNNNIQRRWSPFVLLANLIEMSILEISRHKQRVVSLENIKNGNVYTLDAIKQTYLPLSPKFEGKYPEFQAKLHGLWSHDLALGYLLFYIDGDCAVFVYHPKSKEDSVMMCKCTYALGCHSKDDSRYDLHIIDETAREIHHFMLWFQSERLSIQFVTLCDNGLLKRIIDAYDESYLIGNHIQFNILL
jgi:hypothetical protein